MVPPFGTGGQQSMRHRQATVARTAVAAAFALLSVAAAADAPPDPEQSPVWKVVRQGLFGDRVVADDGGDGEIISLRAPNRAQDASTVPIAISTRIEQTPERYVRKVYLLIDKNPSPIAAIFTFTPESGRADIQTRVRVEEYTWMRAVAELSDGRLFMAARYVKAAGGCSAPFGVAPDFEAFQPQLKLRLGASVVPGQPTPANLMIHHPNSSGLAKDQVTQLYIPAYFVRTVSVTYAGRQVMTAEIDFSISENPNFRFYFVAREPGELKVVAVDTKDREIQGTVSVELDGSK
jgi:sulfur-oxidizing protein SoxY